MRYSISRLREWRSGLDRLGHATRPLRVALARGDPAAERFSMTSGLHAFLRQHGAAREGAGEPSPRSCSRRDTAPSWGRLHVRAKVEEQEIGIGNRILSGDGPILVSEFSVNEGKGLPRVPRPLRDHRRGCFASAGQNAAAEDSWRKTWTACTAVVSQFNPKKQRAPLSGSLGSRPASARDPARYAMIAGASVRMRSSMAKTGTCPFGSIFR